MATTDVRERLLDSGMDAFYARGFNATGVQEIANGANVPKGSFYNHFDSKDAFAVEVVERYWDRGSRALRILNDASVGDPLARLRHYFETLISARKTAKYRSGCLIGNFSSEISDQSEMMRERIEIAFRDWTKLLEVCVREAQDSGLVQTDLPASVVAAFILNAWQGTVLRAKVERGDVPFKQFMTMIFDGFLN
ncbi:TetR/AcrR family transcriptional regulator [Paraburkholderia aspalathi]|uniref:Transcriptional regulator, TetR family n=1 Tax=Paraburkholderia aspalathi TaxID=1324617 RepID=A0A1I7ES65_9BURK|nr:TetR/AcrR family transcriptional regulator [Paraburkholderia aspalathi]SFU26756.1 transcriptional regulator, TetR family [Paraburkholderia aspalathi]